MDIVGVGLLYVIVVQSTEFFRSGVHHRLYLTGGLLLLNALVQWRPCVFTASAGATATADDDAVECCLLYVGGARSALCSVSWLELK